jgi:hypothetical protein
MTCRFRCLCLSPLIAAALAAPAAAMSFTWVEPDPASHQPARIFAAGLIDADDSAALETLLAAHAQSPAAAGRPAELRLASPGGDLFGGIDLGQTIRDHGLTTVVPAANECHSACTVAFLGGTERRIEGTFGIHAFYLDQNVRIGDVTEFVWEMQGASAAVVEYVKAMIGQDDMAEAMLNFHSLDTHRVTAAEAVAWGIITHASTPAQALPAVGALAFCADRTERAADAVHQEICTDIALGRQFAEIAEMTAMLATRPEAGPAVGEDAAFMHSWQACAVPGAPLSGAAGGTDLACAHAAIGARWRQLKAMSEYLDALDTAARAGWHTS